MQLSRPEGVVIIRADRPPNHALPLSTGSVAESLSGSTSLKDIHVSCVSNGERYERDWPNFPTLSVGLQSCVLVYPFHLQGGCYAGLRIKQQA